MMKKTLIKQIAMIGAVVVGMLAFGGTTQANAAVHHFGTRTITYHIDSTSKHYKGIWKDAFNEWNSKGVLKFKATSKKKAMLRATTRLHVKNDYAYSTNNLYHNFDNNYFHASTALNRSYMDSHDYTRSQRVNLATNGIEANLGLTLYDNSRSHMYDGTPSMTPITSYDVAQLKKLYAHVK